MPHLVVLVTMQLLSAPAPPPNLKLAVPLVLLVVVAAGWGVLLGPVLTYVPVAGVLLMLAGIALASAVATNPRAAIVASLLVLGNTIVAVIAQSSSAAAVAIVQLLALAMVMALILAQVAHAIFPEETAAPAPAARALAPGQKGWIGLRAALIMAPPLLLALANPGNYIMVLMKGSQLAQQVEATETRVLGRELVLSTLYGAALALGIWNVLQFWPSLLLLSLLLALAAFVLARPMYGIVASPHRFLHWQNVLVTMILLLGPAVTDSAIGTDIQQVMLQRAGLFVALAVYAAVMVHLLDMMHRRPVPA
jgi:hypothetical protein